MSDIFISYRREGGADRAHLAYNILTQAGYDVFMDRYGISDGQDFSQAIENDVKSCNDYILILSKNMFQAERTDDYVLKEIEWAIKAQKNIILLSSVEDFWTNEKRPDGFPDFDKKNYCYLPDNDQFETTLLGRSFISKKKRTIVYQAKSFGIEIKACNLFEQDGIRVIHCIDDFETSFSLINKNSVFGQLLLKCQDRGISISDCLQEQLAEITDNGQYDLPKHKTRHYPIGTTLPFSLDNEEYRIVAFNHWAKDGFLTKYTIDEYRLFLERLWENMTREGKKSTINITLMGNNFTTFEDALPNTEHKIWMILESLFDAARHGFRCDRIRICIDESDVEQIKFADLKSILRYLDEKQN